MNRSQSSFDVVLATSLLFSYHLIPEMFRAKYLIQETAQMVIASVIAMKPDAPIFSQELPQQNQPLVHELEVVVIGPDIGVLDLLAEAVGFSFDLGGAADPSQLHFAHVVGAGIKRRIDIDQIDFTAKAVR